MSGPRDLRVTVMVDSSFLKKIDEIKGWEPRSHFLYRMIKKGMGLDHGN